MAFRLRNLLKTTLKLVELPVEYCNPFSQHVWELIIDESGLMKLCLPNRMADIM